VKVRNPVDVLTIIVLKEKKEDKQLNDIFWISIGYLKDIYQVSHYTDF